MCLHILRGASELDHIQVPQISVYLLHGVPETLPFLASPQQTTMNIRAGEILKSNEGAFYRVLEATEFSVSLMRVDGQTIFACRPEYVEMNFSIPTSEAV